MALSWPAAHRAFVAHADALLTEPETDPGTKASTARAVPRTYQLSAVVIGVVSLILAALAWRFKWEV